MTIKSLPNGERFLTREGGGSPIANFGVGIGVEGGVKMQTSYTKVRDIDFSNWSFPLTNGSNENPSFKDLGKLRF